MYSRFGGRKTLQIGYLIDLVGPDNVLIVSAERGLGTIKSKVREDMVVVVNNIGDLRGAWAKAKAFAGPGKWVCMDGMTNVMDWIANIQLAGADRYYEALQQHKDPQTEDLVYGKYISKGEINSMAIYNRVGRDSEGLLSSWISLPVNIYASYLEDMTGRAGFEASIPWGPDVPGRVGLKKVMGSFDYVGRLYYDAQNRLIGGFDPTSKVYMARTREDQAAKIVVPPTIENFNLAEFVKLVSGQQEGGPQSTAADNKEQ